MTITMKSTGEVVLVDGVLTRRWLGLTEQGTPVDVFVRILRVAKLEDTAAFEEELIELPSPSGYPVDVMELP